MKLAITDAKNLALSVEILDVSDWLQNAYDARAEAAVSALKGTDNWTSAIAALAKEGGDVSDQWAVLTKMRKLGLAKTAAEKQAETKAQPATAVRVQKTQKPTSEHVNSEVIRRKLALVNASDVNELNDIVSRGTRGAVRLLHARLTREWTKEEKARAERLDRMEAALNALEKTGEALKADIASGKITKVDQIANDKRWP